MLVLRYSEFIDLYSKEERMEFLFKIFENIVVGGEPDKVYCKHCTCKLASFPCRPLHAFQRATLKSWEWPGDEATCKCSGDLTKST